jgi:putative sterol carrier protein
MANQWVINTPEELAATIDGRSDEEIKEGLQSLGIDEALDRVFAGMVDAFLPDKAKNEKATVQWDLATADGPRPYHLIIADGKCEYKRGKADEARVTLAVRVEDFLRVITGKLNSMQAFFQGKLKVSGDVLFAQGQEAWFKKPS